MSYVCVRARARACVCVCGGVVVVVGVGNQVLCSFLCIFLVLQSSRRGRDCLLLSFLVVVVLLL